MLLKSWNLLQNLYDSKSPEKQKKKGILYVTLILDVWKEANSKIQSKPFSPQKWLTSNFS